MTDTPSCTYSKRQIIKAGKLLSRPIAEQNARAPEVIQAFRVARSWREANAYPMRRVRAELVAKARVLNQQRGKDEPRLQWVSAARLKRMVSIRKKLRETHFTLYQMQDIGGCRIILNGMADLRELIEPYLCGESRYSIVRDDDYLQNPDASGYRSRHLIVKFRDSEIAGFDRHFIEIQFRTRLQHAWATTVEAVGLVRDEDLKGGNGDADWLRLFQLMSVEMSLDESEAISSAFFDESKARRKELKDLCSKLKAVQVLDSYNRAIKHTERIFSFSSPYYLIQYDLTKMAVEVKPFNLVSKGSHGYAISEGNSRINSVLVEVDKVADLREAYPNYFLDVGVFVRRLKRTLKDERVPTIDADWLAEFARMSGRGTT